MYDAVNIKVSVFNPKAHKERGRAERKIRAVREMLQRTRDEAKRAMTALEWETRFAVIANALDSIPMAKEDTNSAQDPLGEILTPNRLKLGWKNLREML